MKNLLFRHYIVRKLFGYADFILGLFIAEKTYKEPKKILISNIAHMGDFVVSISAINTIIDKFPHAEVGILCSEQSAEIARVIVAENNVYVYRHWKLNRDKNFFIKKLIIYLHDLYRLKRILKSKNYDLGIDLYPYYPNSMFLLWLAKLRFRLGFASSGLSNLCSISYNIDLPLNKHITEYQKNLLKSFFNICLNFDDDWIIQKYFQKWDISKKNIVEFKNYFVVQIGAGAIEKRWPSKYWGELINSLDDKVIIVGKGNEDLNYYCEIEKSINKKENIVNMINKLSFGDLVNLISKSNCVIAGDSLLTHIAYGLDIPQICILENENNPVWINDHMTKIIKPNVGDILNLIKGFKCLST
jgi:ADP-heptose:LPS heptosyltransferase